MKKLMFICVAVLFVCGLTFSVNAEELTYDQVASHMGDEVTVCGEIIDSVVGPGFNVLGMGVSVGNPSTVGLEIYDAVKSKFPEDLYVGKTICVTGLVHSNPLGDASITIEDPSQVKVK